MERKTCENILQLQNSQLCRLCGQDNPTGQYLNEEISCLVNSYLPLKITNDSRYPQWICPGCHLQVESTVEFFDLVVSGQEYLRSLLGQYDLPPEKVENKLYSSNDKIVQRINGNDKLKRRRGRPSKLPQEIILKQQQAADKERNEKRKLEELQKSSAIIDDYTSARKRRHVKKPSRFNEVVQGSELERIYVEKGVIDRSELLNEPLKIDDSNMIDNSTNIIGQMHDNDGHSLGNVVCDNHFRPSQNTKYYSMKMKTKFICDICRREFIHENRFIAHRATHIVEYECTTCERKFLKRNQLIDHQNGTGHIGQGIVESLEETGNESPHVAMPTTQLMSEINESLSNMRNSDDRQTLLPPTEFISNAIESDESNVEEAAKVLYELQHMDKFIENSGNHILADSVSDENFMVQNQSNLFLIRNEHSSSLASIEQTAENSTKNVISQPRGNCIVNETIFVECDDNDDQLKIRHDCCICNKTFATLTLHDTHFNLVHGKKLTLINDIKQDASDGDDSNYKKHLYPIVGRRFVCSKCGKEFKRKQLLQRHQLVHTTNRPYNCQTCGASFKTKPNLLNHLQTHTGIKKHECTICQQTFTHKTSLTLHYRWHSGEKPFGCDVCGKSFGQNGNLQEHMRIHTGIRPFECEHCGKKFKTSSQCRIHSKRHQKHKPYECEFCQKTFIYVEVYRSHVRRHNNDKPYVCCHCPKKFSEQWALKKHTRTHTGEKPYKCTVCTKSFSDCSNLIKHKKIHDVDNKPQIEVDDSVKLYETVINDDDDGDDIVGWNSIDNKKENNEQHNTKKETNNIIYVTYGDPHNSSSNETLQMTSVALPIMNDDNSTLDIPITSGIPAIENNTELTSDVQLFSNVNNLPTKDELSQIYSPTKTAYKLDTSNTTATETIVNDSTLLDNIYGHSFEIITTDGRKLRLLAPYSEQMDILP